MKVWFVFAVWEQIQYVVRNIYYKVKTTFIQHILLWSLNLSHQYLFLIFARLPDPVSPVTLLLLAEQQTLTTS